MEIKVICRVLCLASTIGMVTIANGTEYQKIGLDALQAQETFRQFIVSYSLVLDKAGLVDAVASDLNRIERTTGLKLEYVRTLAIGAQLFAVDADISRTTASAVVSEFANSDLVVHVEPDIINYACLTPNDPSVVNGAQWHLYPVMPTSQDRLGVDAGINALAGWDYTLGASTIKVAVVDTGYTGHPDFGVPQVQPLAQFDLRRNCPDPPNGHGCGLIPNGWDFVSTQSIPGTSVVYDQNDDHPASPLGRDGDAWDPGTWSTGTGSSPSDWHGTHVLGLIGARINSASYGAGVAPGARLVPVRALGYGGRGYTSDLTDAIVWASGGTVTGVPITNHANVINMSFGGQSACSDGSPFQIAVGMALTNNSVLVAAAGNDGTDVSGFSPASCTGVIAVAATSRSGKRSLFQRFSSNYGSRIDVAAPGGGFVTLNEIGMVDAPIMSTLALGATHETGYTFGGLDGTSMAAPQVAGLAALVLSRNPNLTPAQVTSAIKTHAHPWGQGGLPAEDHPAACLPTGHCMGAGLIDVAATLAAVQ